MAILFTEETNTCISFLDQGSGASYDTKVGQILCAANRIPLRVPTLCLTPLEVKPFTCAKHSESHIFDAYIFAFFLSGQHE